MADDLIRQLIAETEALPRYELPSGAWGTPMVSRVKSPQRYDQDMRRAYFLDKVRERAKDVYLDSPELLRAATEMKELKSPYQPYGADWPIYNAGRWMGSVPGAVYATGQMLANKVDPVANPYPNAPDDYAKNMNNALFFLDEPFGKNKNQMRDMQEMREAQDDQPWRNMIPREITDGLAREVYAAKAEPKAGSQFLREAKVSGPAADVLGAVMDATIDPFFTPSMSWGGLAVDYGLGAAHGTVPASLEAIRKLRDYVNPATNVAYR